MNKDRENLKWLWEKLKGYRALYLVSILGIVIHNIMQLTVAVFSQKIVDTFISGEDAQSNLKNNMNLFLMLVAGMVAVTLVRTIIVYFSCMGCEKASQHVLHSVRNKLFYKIEHQDMYFYEKFRTGDILTRVTGDLDAIRHMLAWVIRNLVECVVLFLAAACYFLYLNLYVALALLAITPVIFFITGIFRRRVAPMHDRLREQLAEMNTAAQENISGNRVVKAFAREDYEIEKFDERNKAYMDANKKTILTWLKFYPFIDGLANMLPVILMVFGGFMIIDGSMTGGEYVAFSTLIWAVINPMTQLGNILNEFQRFSSACAKVREIEISETKIVDADDAIAHEGRFEGRIEFENVCFAFDEKSVLDHVNLSIEPGMTVAIMGETGSGKTSLINMIPRFFDPEEGRVLIDGIDVRKLRISDLRRNIGMATQDILLYSDTIDGNIAYGNSKMSEKNVVYYASKAAAADFIKLLPEGYDTIVGERGVGLSGGQKQRISLARALAVEPSILILDDTTSAVDLETEKYIQQQLRSLEFPCTKIIIAQRISSTKDADRIFIVKDGRIIEQGSHDELVAKQGYYYDIYKLQDGGEMVG